MNQLDDMLILLVIVIKIRYEVFAIPEVFCLSLFYFEVMKVFLDLLLEQNEMYDRIDQALLRQEQLLKAQALQSSSLDGSAR